MDQGANDRFTWRMFLGVVQCLFALRGVHNFVSPHPVLGTELCFAVFLIAFFAFVVELSQAPNQRRYLIEASAEDSQGRWRVSLERERFVTAE